MSEEKNLMERRANQTAQINELRLRLKEALSNNRSLEETVRKLSERVDTLEAEKSQMRSIIIAYSEEADKFKS